MVRFHFSFEEMGGGKETLHHSCPLSRSSSPGICQKKTLSPANFCPCCRTDTKSREAAKPSSAAIPRHPMAQDQLGGGSHTPPPLPYICHLLLVKSIMGYMVSSPLCLPPASLLKQLQACAGPPMPPKIQPVPAFSPRHGLGSHKVK